MRFLTRALRHIAVPAARFSVDEYPSAAGAIFQRNHLVRRSIKKNSRNEEDDRPPIICCANKDKDSDDGERGDYGRVGGGEKLSLFGFIGIVGFFWCCFLLCMGFDSLGCSYHTPVTPSISGKAFQGDDLVMSTAFQPGLKETGFSQTRARKILQHLTSFGPKTVGSRENEVVAVNIIKDTIKEITKDVTPGRVEIMHQIGGGSFSLHFLDNYTNVYENVQNIAVKLHPSSPAVDDEDEASLLVNCHFDTPLTSPGASDDTVNCAAMLEALRVLVQNDVKLRHPVIFLFNGAEENFMQGSHSFITKHPWREDSSFFINLEAAGSGGREILFQAGPHQSAWLLEKYRESVTFPVSSGLWQDIFSTGLIPSDTDFRIFRDYGGMSGLDMAFVRNGYVYHTKHDTEDRIPAESLQRLGDNLMALITNLGDSYWPDEEESEVVFFDFAGLFLVSYGSRVREITTVAAIVLYLALLLDHAHNSNRKYGTYIWHTVKAACYTLISWSCGLFTTAVMGALVCLTRKTMAYYHQPLWVVPLFVVPAFGAITGCQRKASQYQGKQLKIKRIKDAPMMVDMYNDGIKLLFTLMLLAMTGGPFRRSSYIPTLLLLAPSIAEVVLRIMRIRKYTTKWTNLYFGFHILYILPFAMTALYAYWIIIPITGRAADVINPDFLVGAMSVIFVIFLGSYIFPLLIISPWRNTLEKLSFAIGLSGIILFSSTEHGFPYSSAGEYPPMQRVFITHFTRSYHKVTDHNNSQLLREDGGYWIPHLDWNTKRLLPDFVPALARAERVSMHNNHCDGRLWCHAPYPMPAANLVPNSMFVYAKGPEIQSRVKNEHFRFQVAADRMKFTMVIHDAPDHMSFVMAPKTGWRLVQWSFNEQLTESLVQPLNGKPTYYVLYSYGINPGIPLTVWIVVEQDPNEATKDDAKMELMVVSSYLHGPALNQSNFAEFQRTFPSWALTIPAVASIDVFTFK